MFELSVKELAREVGGTLELGSMPPLDGDLAPVGRVVVDSRDVEPGDLFWALSGSRCEGHQFVPEAFARGAVGAVVDGGRCEPWAGGFIVRVDDARRALWRLAAAARRQFSGTVIGVTGSVGKTTTRELIHAVLSRGLLGSASPRNFNSQVGLPLSLLRWNSDDDYAVAELGASQPGQIDSLSSLCQPKIGVLTRIGEAHLEGFGSPADVAAAKAELLANLPEEGWAVLCGDDPWQRRLARGCRARCLFVGRSADCDLVASNVSWRNGELRFRVGDEGYRVRVWGRHHLTSVLAAIAVGRILNISYLDAAAGLADFSSVPGRCELATAGGVTLINDAYNANPTSMRAALVLLREIETPGRRIIVCGDMKELGPASEAAHRRLGGEVVTLAGADRVVACGDFAELVAGGARRAGMPAAAITACENTEQAAEIVRREVRAGDVVLVKGSRWMGLERVVERLRGATETACRAA